jgi:Uncharacterized conserved protein
MEAGEKEMALPHLTKFLTLVTENELSNEARVMLGQKLPPTDNSSNATNKSSTAIQSLKNMILVPSGFFIMGSNNHGEDESPEHKTYLDSYYIDRYEVSATNFSLFFK